MTLKETARPSRAPGAATLVDDLAALVHHTCERLAAIEEYRRDARLADEQAILDLLDQIQRRDGDEVARLKAALVRLTAEAAAQPVGDAPGYPIAVRDMRVHQVLLHLCGGGCHGFGEASEECEARGECVIVVTCPNCGLRFAVDDDQYEHLVAWSASPGRALACGVRPLDDERQRLHRPWGGPVCPS